MLPTEYRVTKLKLNHMFNIVHGSVPEYLKNHINITREPALNTKAGSFACYIPNIKRFGINLFFFTGSKLWNSLFYTCIGVLREGGGHQNMPPNPLASLLTSIAVVTS